MIDTRAVMRSLPLVASVLGRKYGVKVEMGGAEAYTDGKTIHLPAMPSEVPDTLLAMVRGFLDHEAGHVQSNIQLGVHISELVVIVICENQHLTQSADFAAFMVSHDVSSCMDLSMVLKILLVITQ